MFALEPHEQMFKDSFEQNERSIDFDMLNTLDELHVFVKHKYWLPVFNHCGGCHQLKTDIDWRLLNTAYVDEASNWLCSCDQCYGDAHDYYAERWSEYWSSVM